jgi:hypothetical protein
MARIEDNRWIIETEEEAQAIAKLLNKPSKVNKKLQAALDKYKSLGYGESLDNLDLFEQSEAATYCKEDIVTEQNIEDSFTYTRLEKAVKKLREMSKEEYKQFLSKHKNIPIDANTKPWKYATHCLKSAPYNGSIFISNKNNTLLSYINGEWQPSDVYKGILQEIEIECHPEINEECNLIERKSIKRYQEILDTKGVKELNKIYTDLCNSNSMGAIPNIVAIQVVLFNNDIELK